MLNDSTNCGSCGHDCLGGACLAGVCQPVVLATSPESEVATLAIDKRTIYWTTSNGVQSLPKDANPGVAPFVIASNLSAEPTSLATDGSRSTDATSVYFTVPSGQISNVYGARVDGSGLTAPLGTVNHNGLGIALASGGGSLYWGDDAPPSTIVRYDLASAQTQTLAMAAAGETFLIVTDASTVYWQTLIPSSREWISSSPLDGSCEDGVTCDTPYQDANEYAFTTLGVDATSIYWAESNAQAGGCFLASMPKQGGAKTVLVQDCQYVFDVVSDGTTLYFVDSAALYSTPVGTPCTEAGGPGACTQVVSDTLPNQGLAVDDKAIYWIAYASPTSSSVKRLAK